MIEMSKKSFTNQRIGDILLKKGLVNNQQLEEAIKAQNDGDKRKLGKILVENGHLGKEELNEILEFIYETEFIDLSNYIIDPEVIAIIPEKIALQYNLIPVSKNNGELTIAMANPLDVYAIDFVRSHTKIKQIHLIV